MKILTYVLNAIKKQLHSFTHLPEKAKENQVGFQNQNKWEKFIIKPKNKVDENLIKKEWDNNLRILASLAMKETTQAIIIFNGSLSETKKPSRWFFKPESDAYSGNGTYDDRAVFKHSAFHTWQSQQEFGARCKKKCNQLVGEIDKGLDELVLRFIDAS